MLKLLRAIKLLLCKASPHPRTPNPQPRTRKQVKKNLRFRGGLVFKAHILLYHSTLGWRVIKKKKKKQRFLIDAPRSSYYGL